MIQTKYIDKKQVNNWDQNILVLMMFLVGFLNSTIYLNYMGYSGISRLLLLLLYVLLALLTLLTIINTFYKKGNIRFLSIHYWILLFASVLFKFFLLFIQFPSSFLPGNSNFMLLLELGSNFLLLS